MYLEVKVLSQSDQNRIWEIVKDCKSKLNLKSELDWSEESIKDALKSTQILGLIKSENNESQVIGFILYRGLVNEAELDLVALDPLYHGQGLLKLLIDALSEQFETLWLEVHINNLRALRFYEKMGFKVVRTRQRYYKDGADCIVMRRSTGVP